MNASRHDGPGFHGVGAHAEHRRRDTHFQRTQSPAMKAARRIEPHERMAMPAESWSRVMAAGAALLAFICFSFGIAAAIHLMQGGH